jgi:LPXTG-site transpeptidase (sortase) family protein
LKVVRVSQSRPSSRFVTCLLITALALIVSVVLVVCIAAIAWQRPAQAVRESSPSPTAMSAAVVAPAAMPTALPGVDQLMAAIRATTTPAAGPAYPVRLKIESVGINVLVFVVDLDEGGYIAMPDRYAGYWQNSAPLNEIGNTVIVGHNVPGVGAVFSGLDRVQAGDEVRLTDQFGAEYVYRVAETAIVQGEGAPPEEAQRAFEYTQPTDDQRLTLVTCHPDITCPQRLIVIARP